MAGRLSSVEFISGCGGEMAFEMTPVATAPAAQIISGEGKTMHVATKRMVIGAAGLAAAGLFGSLPFGGSTLADQGVPTQHHDVALVDTTSPLDAVIGYETSVDDSLYTALYGPSTGLFAEVYNNAVTALGVTSADTLLGTTAAGGADGIFDGAANSFSSGVFLDTWAAEDELNQLLGISAGTSEGAILTDIGHDPVTLVAGDLLPMAGSSGFDADLMTLATHDFTAATSEFTTYLAGLPSVLGDVGGLGGLLGDLGGGDLSALLSSILGDLGSLGGLGL